MPDLGTQYRTPDGVSPSMSYAVEFATTGTYYVWLRLYASDNNSKLIHVGLDGSSSRTQARGMHTAVQNAWTWTSTRLGGGSGSAVLDVATAGEHTINVWMGDDGAYVDKVVLTTDPGFVPTGYGPPESPRSGGAFHAMGIDTASALALPDEFALEGNYPNPFGSATTIRFAVPEEAQARLVVYDMLGRHLVTLADGEVAPGRYEVRWDASDQPTGIYLVRLTAGSFVATQRIALVR
ncbi:MAG: T9SS type A sorting domain-containing protein [Rhodothermaceae bacterium]|nr:T9SS type A sorting domain-containing protein [Rhodothermaceae bacterium]